MKKLNVKVNDVVRVTLNGQVMEIGRVEKVMPNGRFRLVSSSTYWRADGTKNTRAKKCEKSERVEFGKPEDYEQLIRHCVGERLENARVEVVRASSAIPLDKVKMLNKILDAFDIEETSNELISILEKKSEEAIKREGLNGVNS